MKEFLGDIADQPTSEFYLTEKSRFTDEYDKNKDGKLDKEELVSWLIPNLNVVAREEAVHLIESADKDHVSLEWSPFFLKIVVLRTSVLF